VGTSSSTLGVEFVPPVMAKRNCPQSGREEDPTQSVGTRG